jgi:hypothetical protein
MLTSLLSLVASAMLVANPPAPKSPAPAPAIPSEIFVAEKPADAKPLAEAKKNAKQGDKVVFEAKIGGRPEPFVKNRAIFGEEETECASSSEPCCGSSEARSQKLLTIQFVDKDGKPLRVGAEGVHGLESRARIVVEGTVAKVDDKGNVTVTATKVFVEKPEQK